MKPIKLPTEKSLEGVWCEHCLEHGVPIRCVPFLWGVIVSCRKCLHVIEVRPARAA